MFFSKPEIKVLACRMAEAIIFDERIVDNYKYLYFPGMCPCIGVIIKDKANFGRTAGIHFLPEATPESVLKFIKNYFPSKNIDIITFAGNPPPDGAQFKAPEDFPTISASAPNIKDDELPILETSDPYSDESYYNRALRNRYEFNYILKELSEQDWNINHSHDDTVHVGDNVFFDVETHILSANLHVKVIRDDFNPEERKNIFFNEDVPFRTNLSGNLYRLWNGWNNIVVTDKRSWAQYSYDLIP